MDNNQALFETIFKRNFSDPGNKHFLNEITAAHPYFSPAQFYLLQQTEEGTESFKKQAAKTSLLFNNPLWLHFLMQQAKQTISFKKEHIPIPEWGTLDNDEQIVEPEIEPMKIELKLHSEKNTLNEMPLFEPMHMVDYFASQGIKLTEEVQTADKLGKQLKSFTEWLKTMKKVHVENQGQDTEQTDITIQNQAERSNRGDEVLTVSMADVFVKQGKIDKALEILEKLSLLNPAKSAYFAAKIEHLKGL